MTEKNISRRRALGFAAKTAGVAGAASVAMSVNAPLAQAAPRQDDWLPNAWNTIAEGEGDQFPEIQAALNRAEEEGGGIVHLESGTFRIGNTLSIGENVTLQGTGAGTELRATGGMPWMVQFPASSFLAALKDIRLFGGGYHSPHHRRHCRQPARSVRQYNCRYAIAEPVCGPVRAV